MNENTHGMIDSKSASDTTDSLFRISVKGLIRNERGQILVVKETGRAGWDMPGGGMEQTESFKEAIARELHEEVKLVGNFSYRIIAVEEPARLKRVAIWQIRMIFEVIPENMIFEPGVDGDEVMFIDPEQLKDSDDLHEQKVYEYSLLAA